MAKVFIAVVPNSEAEAMVIEELKDLNSRCALGDVFGYTANFYETGFTNKGEAEKLIQRIISKNDTVRGLCKVTLAKDYVVMTDFMKRCLDC